MTESMGLAELYRDTRERLCALVSGLDDSAHATAVPACPGWAVRDVIAHLTAIVEDAIAGRLAGIPDEEFTAGQIARMADVPVAAMLDRWAAGAPQFEDTIQAFEVWPAVIDVATHEQDIRGAVGAPGARDCAAIKRCTPMLLDWLAPPVPMRIGTEDGDQVVGTGDQAQLVLSTSRFEAFRWRMGRRSSAQLAAMNWSADPALVLGELTIFGPSPTDIVE
ncbi:MAG TPA: maleylpyruvate isomerase family mycothiol-dependent enzyme [Streptosporangiaceae bacterium]|nr:maleylpyruvate isomerase family mycothiol-dependent enzyme [Streptosporangiaceae bacterium]